MTKLEGVVLLRGRRARVLDCDGRGSVGAVAARAARLPHPGRGTRPLAHTCDRGREMIDLFASASGEPTPDEQVAERS